MKFGSKYSTAVATSRKVRRRLSQPVTLGTQLIVRQRPRDNFADVLNRVVLAAKSSVVVVGL